MPEFKIQHLTKYTYEKPVRDSANQIILYPLKDEYQDVLKHEIKITGDPAVDTHLDYYGNEVGNFTQTEPHSQLEILSKALISTKHRLYPMDDMFTEQQWNDLFLLKGQISFIDFLRQEYFNGYRELQELVESSRLNEETPYKAAVRFCRYVYENFKYNQGITTVETTLDEIWKLKAGVCQDFAHILTEMLRMSSIPARYVSGYIHTQKTSMRGEGATHAWAEAYIPGYGWLGLDPTNNIIANENHIRLAFGRNFLDCSPVKGVYKGSSEHTLEVAVTVSTDYDLHSDDTTEPEPLIIKPAGSTFKNSYREYIEMQQHAQQQQQRDVQDQQQQQQQQ